MQITIEIDDNEFGRQVVDLLVQRTVAIMEKEMYPGDHYSSLRRRYSEDVKGEIRNLIKANIDDLSRKAVDAAATTIANKALKQQADKITEAILNG